MPVSGRILQRFERARADAARRKIHHAQERAVVLGTRDQAQISERVLDFHALEKAQAAVDAVGNAGREQRMLQNARLRVGAVEHADLAPRQAIAMERLDFLGQPVGLVAVGLRLVDAQRLAVPGGGPQVLAQALPVVGNQRVGRIQNVAVRAIVLLQADHVLDVEVALEIGHVADVRAAERVDGLVVVADREYHAAGSGQQLQPAVLQAVGVLELVHQDVAEARAVVLAQDFVFRQQFEAPEQQLGEIDHALALALLVVGGVDFGVAAAELVVGLGLARALAFFLVGVDVVLHLLGRKAVLVHVHRLQHALHQRQLVGRVEDLEQLRQPGVAVMRAQQAVAQPVEGAHPHAAGGDRQHGGNARNLGQKAKQTARIMRTEIVNQKYLRNLMRFASSHEQSASSFESQEA